MEDKGFFYKAEHSVCVNKMCLNPNTRILSEDLIIALQ